MAQPRPRARRPRPARTTRVTRRSGGARVAVAVFLVAAEDDHVAWPQHEDRTAGAELDLSALAGEVLARAGGVRDTAHRGARRQLHPFDLEPRDRLGQELAHRDQLARPGRQRRRGVEATEAPRRLDQLFQPHLQRLRDLDQDRQDRIRHPRLQVRPGGPRDPGHPRDHLLRLPARLAQRLDVAPQIRRRVRSRVFLVGAPGHLANTLAP